MAALLDIVKKGSTDRSVTIRIIDSADGTPETGVVFDSAGIDLWYRREGGLRIAITEADLATPALDDAHADGGFLHISDGEYRLDLPDAAFATGANYVDVGGTVTGMVVIGGRVRLVDYDAENAVDLGLSEIGTLVDGAVTAGKIAAGALTAAKFAADYFANFQIDAGTAQAGAVSTITLRAGAPANDLKGAVVFITGSTGVGQTRLITNYNTVSKLATVSPDWSESPDATSTYTVVPFGAADVRLWLGGTPPSVSAGRIIADVDAIKSNGTAATNLQTLADADVPGRVPAALTAGGHMKSDLLAISGDATAADRLEALMDGILVAQVNDAGATTTTFVADGFTEATDDHFIGRLITFLTGALAGQQTAITDYTGATQTFTVEALTEAPADDVFFVIH